MKKLVTLSLMAAISTFGVLGTANALNVTISNSNSQAQMVGCDDNNGMCTQNENPHAPQVAACKPYPSGSYDPHQKTLCVNRMGLVVPAGSSSIVTYAVGDNQRFLIGVPSAPVRHICDLTHLTGTCDAGNDVTVTPAN